MKRTPLIAIPLRTGEQWADSDAVFWDGPIPRCATCLTSLAMGGTVGPTHALNERPTKVAQCPVCGP